MTHWKQKLEVAVSAILLVAAVPSAAAPDVQQMGLSVPDVLAKTWAAYVALSSYSDEVKLASSSSGKRMVWHATVKMARPNLYRVEWHRLSVTPSDAEPTKKATFALWSQGDGAWSSERKWPAKDGLLPFTGEDLTQTPVAFFGETSVCGTFSPECYKARYQMEPEEKVGDVDCYVLTRDDQQSGMTLWIGKGDFLLRQVRTIMRFHSAIKTDLIVSTQTHSNIVMNVPMSPSDFIPSTPN